MTENNLSKLKTMLNLKYMSFVLISLMSSGNENKAYISSELAQTYDSWENWKFNHGIKEV